MPTGTVKWFSVAKGFGFITPDDGTADVFLHVSKVEEANLPTLENGIALRYSIGSPERESLCRRILGHFQSKGTSTGT
jgi:CspA family cold shock protein